MNTDTVAFTSLTEEQQERLPRLMDEYFVALERGQPISRAELVGQHPDLAEQLGEYFDSLEFLQDAAAGFRAHPESLDANNRHDARRKEIGDFEIGREVGRGGMGVVYESRQISLNRRVALKMLPFAALLDSKQVARFRNEAQAAAQLLHPNIVPVYSVGTDRGVHYFAMQFIDGQPLDRAIEELRRTKRSQSRQASSDSSGSLVSEYSSSESSYFRTIARLIMQAADALHAAHEFGIVHRDVKPSNLLLDAEGKLWVTDFGLARFRSDAQLTQSGDFVGTIRYMSPEQARGESHLVDHRTDIYSLGVTLYELLALKHPVRAEQPAAILLKLDSETPYRLRLWNPKIPVDLENIVQKAMAKSRDERYRTAKEFADDLRRFLDGKPTIAKRPTVVNRTTKWIRRHKVVASFVAALMLAVIGLLASTTMLFHQKSETEQALAQAEENHQQYRVQLALSSNHIAFLHDQSGDTQQAKSAFQKAVELQREILEEQPDDEVALRNLASTLNNLSFFYAKHDPAQATRCYEETLAIQKRLVNLQPEQPQYRDDLALTYSNFGSLLTKLGKIQLAVESYAQAIDILETLYVASPDEDNARDLAVACNNLGMTQDAIGQIAESEASFRNALRLLQGAVSLATPMDMSLLGGVHNNLGMVLERQERWQDAAASYVEAIQCQRSAADQAPRVRRFQELVVKHQENQSRVMRKLDQAKGT